MHRITLGQRVFGCEPFCTVSREAIKRIYLCLQGAVGPSNQDAHPRRESRSRVAQDAERGHIRLMNTSLLWVFESLFGCHHQQLSRVFTIRRRTYQVCVECGREFEYSWERMHSMRSSGWMRIPALEEKPALSELVSDREEQPVWVSLA